MRRLIRLLFAGPLLPAGFIATACWFAYQHIGLPPVIIVGGSAIIGMGCWLKTYAGGVVPPRIILPPFLLTVAGLEIHMIEEYFMGFGPAMSRLFDITWSQSSFLVIFTFAGPIVYTLTALGLFLERRLAGFVAWFIFIGPGVAEFTHFIFPVLRPAIAPIIAMPVDHTFHNGSTLHHLPNFYVGITHHYYFPGLYTALLPMIPGIWGISRVIRWVAAHGSRPRA